MHACASHKTTCEGRGVVTLDICSAQACVLLNLATLVNALVVLVYGAMLRTSMRERFGIHGAHLE